MKKIEMIERDFIELITSLAENEKCCVKLGQPVDYCGIEMCYQCWAKMLSKYIEV